MFRPGRPLKARSKLSAGNKLEKILCSYICIFASAQNDACRAMHSEEMQSTSGARPPARPRCFVVGKANRKYSPLGCFASFPTTTASLSRRPGRTCICAGSAISRDYHMFVTVYHYTDMRFFLNKTYFTVSGKHTDMLWYLVMNKKCSYEEAFDLRAIA